MRPLPPVRSVRPWGRSLSERAPRTRAALRVPAGSAPRYVPESPLWSGLPQPPAATPCKPLFPVSPALMARHDSPQSRVPSLWWSGPAPPRPPVSLPPRVVEQPGPQIAPRLPRTAFHGRVVARRRSTTRSPHAVVERQHPHGCTPWRGPVRIMIPWHVPRTMLSQCCVERPVAWIGAAGGVRERPLARGRVSASLRAAVPGVTSPGGERPRPESGDAGAARNSRIRENGPIVRDL